MEQLLVLGGSNPVESAEIAGTIKAYRDILQITLEEL